MKAMKINRKAGIMQHLFITCQVLQVVLFSLLQSPPSRKTEVKHAVLPEASLTITALVTRKEIETSWLTGPSERRRGQDCSLDRYRHRRERSAVRTSEHH